MTFTVTRYFTSYRHTSTTRCHASKRKCAPLVALRHAFHTKPEIEGCQQPLLDAQRISKDVKLQLSNRTTR